jgi:hypothetical protein
MDTMCNVDTQYNVTIKKKSIKKNKQTKYNNYIRWYLHNIGHTSVWYAYSIKRIR